MVERVAIVTGGAQGIGLGIGRELLARGFRLSVWDRDATALDAVPEALGVGLDRIVCQQVDVTDRAEIQDATERLRTTWKAADVLVNNAGIARDKRLVTMSEEEWDVVLDVNLKSQFLCCKAVVPDMVEAGYGRIVNISSRAWLGGFGQVNYSASKGGVVSLTRTLAIELARKGITVNAIAPGIVETPLLLSYTDEQRARLAKTVPMERIGSVEDVARVVAFFAAEENAYLTGQLLYVCGGRSLSSPNV